MSISHVLGNIFEPSISARGTQRHFFHVWARLASVYYQKFVELREHTSWAPLIR